MIAFIRRRVWPWSEIERLRKQRDGAICWARILREALDVMEGDIRALQSKRQRTAPKRDERGRFVK